MKAGFDLGEASDLLRLAYAVCLPLNRLAIGADPTAPKGPTPSPYQPLWPEGWGRPAGHLTWTRCIFESVIPVLNNSSGKLVEVANTALLAYNASRNQYALVFAGTKNEINALQDLMAIPVSAGPLSAGEVKSATAQYDSRTATSSLVDEWLTRLGDLVQSPARYVPADYAPPRPAQMHLGFRLAFESLNFPLTMPLQQTLREALAALPDGAELLIAGHSLGGALATVASAWLTSGNLDKSFQVKTYSFAAPKSGNESYANWLDQRLTNAQLFYRLYHSLDTIPQVPFTFELPKADLNNPDMLMALVPSNLPTWLQTLLNAFLSSELPGGASLNFTHAGSPYVLTGSQPLVFNGDTWPQEYFPGLPPQPFFPDDPVKQAMMRQWWPHMPWTYLALVKSLQG